jgi:hypothetical protein
MRLISNVVLVGLLCATTIACMAGCGAKTADVSRDAGIRDASRDVSRDTGLDSRADSRVDSGARDGAMCDHDCLGGACQGGKCQPVVLANVGEEGVAQFAIDETSLYWTTSYVAGQPGATGGLMSKCPLAGCAGAPTTLATGQDSPVGLWVVGSTLYWQNVNGGSIMRCSTDCNDDPTTFYSWTNQIAGPFAANVTEAFMVTGSESVGECPTSGCGLTTFATGQASPVQIVATDASVYWVDLGATEPFGKGDVMFVDGGIVTCPVSGCADAATTLVGGVRPFGDLAVVAGVAYWVQGPNADLVACEVSGCDGVPKTVVSGIPGGIEAFAVDGSGIYFQDFQSEGVGGSATTTWQISRCPITGCSGAPTLLYSALLVGGMPEVLVDATRVYFIAGNYGSEIVALAK